MSNGLKAIDSFEGEFEFLSNFYEAKITLSNSMKEDTFPTNEHAFQWYKTVNKAQADAIRDAETPGKAKRLGRKCDLVTGWEQIKDRVMLSVVREKFNQHPHLATLLLATGDRPLVEGNTWGDKYWGVCNGIGENKLGKILEKVRGEIRNRAIPTE